MILGIETAWRLTSSLVALAIVGVDVRDDRPTKILDE